MIKRFILGGGLGFVVALGIAYAIPATRYPILGYLQIERLHNGRPIGYWISALKADDAAERRQAALHLGDAGGEKTPLSDADRQAAIAALVETLGDSDGFVRKCAATSFLMYPKDAEVPKEVEIIKSLTAALQDQEVVVRQAAARALWQAGAAAKEGEGVARLTGALADKDDFVRAYAARALARIGPDAKDAVPTLVRVLRADADRDVRKLAAKSLGLIGPAALGASRAEAMTELTKMLKKGETDEMREYSARALGQLDASEAIPALQAALADRDQQVRAAVSAALKRLQEKSP